MQIDEKYMRRALQLAARGRGFTAPNPMVGAVIVAPDGRIIGEGWHRLCGQGHAEVNAVASVSEADIPLLQQSTMYVTLEPCSHYGKTPPCARMLIERGIPRVVVGASDPNPKVNGRGLQMLRDSGVEVVSGVLARESEDLNRVFFTAQREHRPYVILKWAQSDDGFMDCKRTLLHPGAWRFSTDTIRLSTMKLRAENEAILTTAATVNADNPEMGLHSWQGRIPRVFILEGEHTHLNTDNRIINPEILRSSIGGGYVDPFGLMFSQYGITSVLVEAGGRYLANLLASREWDEMRVETDPVKLGKQGAIPAPAIPEYAELISDTEVDGHRLLHFRNPMPGFPPYGQK